MIKLANPFKLTQLSKPKTAFSNLTKTPFSTGIGSKANLNGKLQSVAKSNDMKLSSFKTYAPRKMSHHKSLLLTLQQDVQAWQACQSLVNLVVP